MHGRKRRDLIGTLHEQLFKNRSCFSTSDLTFPPKIKLGLCCFVLFVIVKLTYINWRLCLLDKVKFSIWSIVGTHPALKSQAQDRILRIRQCKLFTQTKHSIKPTRIRLSLKKLLIISA